MRNNLFKQVNSLIDKKTEKVSSPVMPSLGNNQNVLGAPIIVDNGSTAKIEQLNNDINLIKTNMVGIPERILSGMEVKAVGGSVVSINSGSVYTRKGVYELSEQSSYRIDVSKQETQYIVIDNGILKTTNEINDNVLLIAKIVINVINDEIDDNANADYSNNYIVSGRDLAINPQFEIDDDTRLMMSNILQEILASNLVGTIRLNEGLDITNQQDSVRLTSTGMGIYNDDVKFAEFIRDGIYFYNESGLMLSQYTKNGATVGNISIQPNSIQSTNFLAGNRGFQIKSDGNVEFNNITARGTIVARDGKIGGWTIGATELYAGEGVSRVGLRPGSYPIYAGSNTPSQAPFRVDDSGNLYAQDGTFKGALQSTVMTKNAVNVNSGNLIITSSSKIIENISSGATSINILDSGVFIANDLVKIGTEVIRVISASSTNLTVSRAFDSTASTHVDGDVVYKIGEYNTNDKGYIELKGDDNQIIIHDIDADTSNYTDTETVILGKLATGKYGLRMIEGEIGLAKHEYSSTTAGIWLGLNENDYKLNIGSEYKYLKWTGTNLEIKGTIQADNIQENYYIVDHATYGSNLNAFFSTTTIVYPAVIQFEEGTYTLTGNIPITASKEVTFSGFQTTIINFNANKIVMNGFDTIRLNNMSFTSNTNMMFDINNDGSGYTGITTILYAKNCTFTGGEPIFNYAGKDIVISECNFNNVGNIIDRQLNLSYICRISINGCYVGTSKTIIRNASVADDSVFTYIYINNNMMYNIDGYILYDIQGPSPYGNGPTYVYMNNNYLGFKNSVSISGVFYSDSSDITGSISNNEIVYADYILKGKYFSCNINNNDFRYIPIMFMGNGTGLDVMSISNCMVSNNRIVNSSGVQLFNNVYISDFIFNNNSLDGLSLASVGVTNTGDNYFTDNIGFDLSGI